MVDSTTRGPPAAPDVTGSQWGSLKKDETVEYDAETETYRTSFDTTTQSVSAAVISTIAAISETPPIELPPLYSVVEPDALEKVVDARATGPTGRDVHVSLSFEGYDVSIASYGIIEVRRPDDELPT